VTRMRCSSSRSNSTSVVEVGPSGRAHSHKCARRCTGIHTPCPTFPTERLPMAVGDLIVCGGHGRDSGSTLLPSRISQPRSPSLVPWLAALRDLVRAAAPPKIRSIAGEAASVRHCSIPRHA
jgi:hypothetical protein